MTAMLQDDWLRAEMAGVLNPFAFDGSGTLAGPTVII